GHIVGDSVEDFPEVGERMREAGELAVGAVHHMPGDHQYEADDRKSTVPKATTSMVVGKGRRNAEQHAGDAYAVGRDAQPRKMGPERGRQRMDEVEVGDLLDLSRAPDRLGRFFCLRLRHLRSRVPAGLVTALIATGSLSAGPSVQQRPTTAREPIVLNSVF